MPDTEKPLFFLEVRDPSLPTDPHLTKRRPVLTLRSSLTLDGHRRGSRLRIRDNGFGRRGACLGNFDLKINTQRLTGVTISCI